MSDLPDEKDDLRASLEAAFSGDDAPAGVAVPETPIAAVEADAPQRDEHGRFAPKAEADVKIPDQPVQPALEAQPEPIQPPASWSAQAKADFAALPEHIRQEVLKREADVNKGFEERASQLKRYEPLDEVMRPLEGRLAMSGLDKVSYVRSLVAADEALRGPNPMQALAQVAAMYGIQLPQMGQPGQQPQQAQPFQGPHPLEQRFQQLETQLTQQDAARQAEQHAQMQAKVDSFAKDHLYFANVEQDMIGLISSKLATSLEDAYEKACWARSDIRPLMLAEQQSKGQGSVDAARQRASDAKRAAGSVTGSPAPGSAPAPQGGPAPSIRESLQREFAARV